MSENKNNPTTPAASDHNFDANGAASKVQSNSNENGDAPPTSTSPPVAFGANRVSFTSPLLNGGTKFDDTTGRKNDGPTTTSATVATTASKETERTTTTASTTASFDHNVPAGIVRNQPAVASNFHSRFVSQK